MSILWDLALGAYALVAVVAFVVAWRAEAAARGRATPSLLMVPVVVLFALFWPASLGLVALLGDATGRSGSARRR